MSRSSKSNIFNTTVKLLDLTNGAIQTSIQALPPVRGGSQLGTVPVEWLDGTHLYVHKSGSSTFSLSGDLYAVKLSSESSSSSTSVSFGTFGKMSNKREKTQLAIGSVSGGDLMVFAPFSSTSVQFDIVGWGAI